MDTPAAVSNERRKRDSIEPKGRINREFRDNDRLLKEKHNKIGSLLVL